MGCSDRDRDGVGRPGASLPNPFINPLFPLPSTPLKIKQQSALPGLTWFLNLKCFLEILNLPNSVSWIQIQNLAFQQRSQIILRLPDDLTIWK